MSGWAVVYSPSSALEYPSYLAVRHLNKGPAARAELRQLDDRQVLALMPFSITSSARFAAADKVLKRTHTH